MENTSWTKQGDEPLFTDVLWSLPQTKTARGSLLIIGGSGQQFSAVSEAYDTSTKAGIGTINLAVPSSLDGIVPSGPHTFFLPSTRTNTISSDAAGELKRLASANEAVLLCGDIGRSSQTSQALAALLVSSSKQVIVTRDAVEAFTTEPYVILDRANTIIVLSISQLQRMLGGKTTRAITHDMGLVLLIQTLQRLDLKAMIVTYYQGTLLVCDNGHVSTTKLENPLAGWRLRAASYVSVFAIQHKASRFEAATTAIHQAFVKTTSQQ